MIFLLAYLYVHYVIFFAYGMHINLLKTFGNWLTKRVTTLQTLKFPGDGRHCCPC